MSDGPITRLWRRAERALLMRRLHFLSRQRRTLGPIPKSLEHWRKQDANGRESLAILRRLLQITDDPPKRHWLWDDLSTGSKRFASWGALVLGVFAVPSVLFDASSGRWGSAALETLLGTVLILS